MVEILLSHYYNQPVFFPYMPASVFNALEQAFTDGRKTARVPVADYDRMMNDFMYNSKVTKNERNNANADDEIRPTAVF